ncbi:MAG: prolipoprotein diacylglyceryl transferase [Planctomycetaceae bacterium]|nr:prolipoprotein diacylglyceryl transferase [Planctomycetaceae bacterium]
MRKVLLRFVFDQLWKFESANNELLVGYGWLIAFWFLIAAISAAVMFRTTRNRGELLSSLPFWAAVPTIVALIPILGLKPAVTGIPVFGYGFMLFVGFSTATLLATRRAETVGLSTDTIWDLMIWLLIPGIIGARITYLLQYGDRVLAGKHGVELLTAILALWDGGIVFFGCIIGGMVGMLIFCRRRGIRFFQLSDVVMPSLFVGLGFGRIGCFLYGCCFGAPCSLPWGVSFPPDSMTYPVLQTRGPEFILPDGSGTIPLHPTQIYSSVLAFCLAAFLAWYFRRRTVEGSVTALACCIYPVGRFAMEIVRDDEPGRLGTGLTFSQLVSLFVMCLGVALLLRLRHSSPDSSAEQGSGAGQRREGFL